MFLKPYLLICITLTRIWIKHWDPDPASKNEWEFMRICICNLKFSVIVSMTFWGGSGSGSGSLDPCFWLMDLDLDPGSGSYYLVIDLQDASKKIIFNTIFSAYYFLKIHLQHFSKIKTQKESQNRRNQGFSYYFCMMIEGSRSGTGSWSIPLTGGSGSGSGRPKNMLIRIRNTAVYPIHMIFNGVLKVTVEKSRNRIRYSLNGSAEFRTGSVTNCHQSGTLFVYNLV